ncbi:hypothetical protein Hte_009709 [Hypoxylon texense]
MAAVSFPARRLSSRVENYNITPTTFLANHPQYDSIAVAALVMLGDRPNTRALIAKRDTNVNLPGRWEAPFGFCNNPNLTLLTTLDQILQQETNLRIEYIPNVAGTETFRIPSGKKVHKITFIVQAQNGVPTTLHDYQAWDVVSLDEVAQARSINFGPLVFFSLPHRLIILAAFPKYDEILSFRSWCRGGTI